MIFLSQSRQIHVPNQSEYDKKHFEPKYHAKDKELKKLKLVKVDVKKENALLTKQTKEITREIEELEKRKRTVEKFSAGNRQFAAVRDSALKSHAIVSSQASTINRNDIRDVVQQPAEKRLKIDSNTKNSSKKFLTPPPKAKTTPRQISKPRPNLKPQSDVIALFEENERSQSFEISTKMNRTQETQNDLEKPMESTSQTPSQSQNTQTSDHESTGSSYGFVSLKDIDNFTAWPDDGRANEELENDCLNSTLATVPIPKESPTKPSPPKSQIPTQNNPKKVIKKHHETINKFSKAQKRIRYTKNRNKFGHPGSKSNEEVKHDLIEIAKVAPHRVKPIRLPKFRVAKETLSFDYFDMTIQKAPKWLKAEKSIPPKRFGFENRVVTMNPNIPVTPPKSYPIPVHDIERLVVSEKSIKRSEFVENLCGRISEFSQLIVEDNHKCYLYSCKDFYQLLESAKKAIYASPAQEWLS